MINQEYKLVKKKKKKKLREGERGDLCEECSQSG